MRSGKQRVECILQSSINNHDYWRIVPPAIIVVENSIVYTNTRQSFKQIQKSVFV
jgi:hypothetical protein